jgi:hypothetical protein
VLDESLPVIGHVFVFFLNITGHNDSTSPQIHDRSQATTIQEAQKYMTDDRPCIYVLVESLWPVIGHVFFF